MSAAADKPSKRPSVQPNDTAKRRQPHSSGDRSTQSTSQTRDETFGGGVYRRPNLDVPQRSEEPDSTERKQ